jgi:hypothetical protein
MERVSSSKGWAVSIRLAGAVQSAAVDGLV